MMSNFHFLTIGEVAKEFGVTTQTIRNWEKQNILIPYHRLQSGWRYYTSEQVEELKKKLIKGV